MEVFRIKRGMPYSPDTAISDRFLRLLEFCRRRGIELVVSLLPGWTTIRNADGRLRILVQPCEIEADSDLGLLLLAHEVGHALAGIPWRFARSSRRWYRRGTLLGLLTVLPDEFAAWVAGFFLLRVLKIAIPAKYTLAVSVALREQISIWRRARAAQEVQGQIKVLED